VQLNFEIYLKKKEDIQKQNTVSPRSVYICVKQHFVLNKDLHILFLCSWYPSRVHHTNGDFIQRHAQAVASRHKVSVLHLVTDDNLVKPIDLEIRNENGLTNHIGYIKKTWNPVYKVFLFLKAYFQILTKLNKIDVVHLNTLFPLGVFALHLKWFRNIPYITSEHWSGYHFPLSKNISNFEHFLSKKIARNAFFICTVSKNLAISMQRMGLKGNYHPVPNVTKTDIFSPKKEELRKSFKILHVSNMNNAIKNISGILNAFVRIQEKIPKLEMLMIGEMALSYQKEVTSMGLSNSIELKNHLPQKKLADYYKSADLFVLFSNTENLPCVILESFSTGTPVISTDVGGISEFFPKNFGSLISAQQEEELASEIISFYNNEKTFAQPSEMHSYVEQHFSETVICKQFGQLYKKALQGDSKVLS
jgi:glycosyltransferase involved in cell wall biosynthesis